MLNDTTQVTIDGETACKASTSCPGAADFASAGRPPPQLHGALTGCRRRSSPAEAPIPTVAKTGANRWRRASSARRPLLIGSLLLCALLVLLAIVYCFVSRQKWTVQIGQRVCLTPTCVRVAGRMLSKMDRSVAPCDDFYQYACGNWIADTKVPPPWRNWHEIYRLGLHAWTSLQDEMTEPRRNLSSSQRKAADLFASCLNRGAIHAAGFTPLARYAQRLGGWPEPLVPISDPVEPPLLSVRFNRVNGTNVVLMTEQAVRATEAAMVDVGQRAFQADARLLAATAREVMQLELRLAMLSWAEFLNAAMQLEPGVSVQHDEPVVVVDRHWLANLTNIFNEYMRTADGIRILKSYMKWRAISYLLSMIDVEAIPPQTRRAVSPHIAPSLREKDQRGIFCLTRVFQVVLQPLVSLYLRTIENTAEQIKVESEAMAAVMKQTMLDGLGNVPWMDHRTRLVTVAKVSNMVALVSHDEKQTLEELDKEYSELSVSRATFFDNMLSAMRTLRRRDDRMLRQQPAASRWSDDAHAMRPNAYYTFKLNRLVIPAAILQPPVMEAGAPKSVNYGALGGIVGHEMMHSFDGRGRKFDQHGNLHDWWTRNSAEEYDNLTECLVGQYSNYTIDKMPLDGRKTMNENLADNGALRLALAALRRDPDNTYSKMLMPGLDMNGDQVFFLSYAQLWCAVSTPEFYQTQIASDLHAPEKFRVLGVLHNMKEFSEAFSCKLGSPMNPEKKCPPFW